VIEPSLLPRASTTARKLGRLGLVLIGYVVAWYAGELAVWFKNRGISEAEMQVSSGMFAFGDAIQFLLFASLLAIPPTLLLVKTIPPGPAWSRAYSFGSLLLSCTGVLAALLWFLPLYHDSKLLEPARVLAVLRVLTAPVFLLGAVPGLLQAPGPSRKRSFIACAFELCTIGGFLVWALLQRR